MTTTLQNATPDDLLTFLRSDTPLPKRPPRKRVAATVTGTSDTCHRVSDTPRRPLSPIEAATLRRPPRAATRYYADQARHRKARDYGEGYRSEERGDVLNRVECRAVAWLVCRSLGPEWRIEFAEDRHKDHTIVHRATAAAFSFGLLWSDKSRYKVSAVGIYRKLDSITVSAERSPADIAGDITRRLISKGLFDLNAERRQTERDSRDDETRERRRLLQVARAYGGNLTEKRCWKSPSYPEATREQFGHVWVDGETEGWKTNMRAATSYHGGLDLHIGTCDVELSIKIAATVREFYKNQ